MAKFYRLLWALFAPLLRAADVLFGAPTAVHAAASADVNTQSKDGTIYSLPVYTGTTIYKGTMVCMNASGYAVPAADTSGYSNVMGVADEQVINSGASGAKRIRVVANRRFRMAATSLTQAMVGSKVYAVDDQTVDDASITNDIVAGILVEYESATVGWVLINPVAIPTVPSGTISGTLTVTSASASALAVGRLGATTPAFQVDASAATQVIGIKVTGRAALGAGAAIAVVGGTNENLTIDAQGSGTIAIGATSTGAISLGRATSVAGAVTITSAGAAAISVGRQGATNPAFVVDASTATQLTGLKVTAAGTGAGVAVAVIEAGGTNNALTVDAMGSGTISLGTTSTGLVILGRGSAKGVITQKVITDIDAQNATPTIAQLLGGVIRHTSVTGAGTCTTPTGANISGGIAGVQTGDSFEVLYINDGNQTVTLTAGDGNVTFALGSLVAIPTQRAAVLKFLCTGANTWYCLAAAAAAA